MAGVVVDALVGISDVGDPDVAGRVGGEVSGVEDPGGEEVSVAGVGGPGGEGEVVAGTSVEVASTGRPASFEIIFSASMGWISRRWISLFVLWCSSAVGCVLTSLSMMFDSPVSSAWRDCIIPVMSRR